MRRGPKPAKSKDAKPPAVGRKSPKSDDARVRDLEKRLAESLEREKAAGEILRVISSSPAAVQPTFEAIARAAMSLCEAAIGSLFRFDGQLIHVGAFHGTPKEVEASRRAFPQRPGHGSVTARAILAATVVQIDDVSKDPEAADALRAFRTVLSVPMIRDGRSLGAITVARRVVRPFSDEQIALLQTFANQAVIAIENVRLFTELQQKNEALTQAHAQVSEALEQQTATSEILRVISSSPTDVQPVFDAIAESSVRLCDGLFGAVYRFDGELMHFVAHYNFSRDALHLMQRQYPTRPRGLLGCAIRDRAVVHSRDVLTDPRTAAPDIARALGYHSYLAVPMLRESQPIGGITVCRAEAEPFSSEQIKLLQTFADQAVIAIENVRLFTELQEKNRALTAAHAQTSEALEQQTATSEILRVISSSPTDVGPVFAAVATSAARLCDAFDAAIHRIDGDVLRLVAHEGPIQPDAILPLAQGTFAGHVVRERRAMHVADLQAEADVYPMSSEFARNRGFRTILGVPLLRGTEVLGTITIRRSEVRLFTDRQAELLKTFADQAVIAIENVRLFKELQEKNRALTQAHAQVTEALEQQTATSEILRVISSSPTDLQPVLDAVAQSAARLCNANDALIYRLEGERLELVAKFGQVPYATEGLPLTRGLVTSRAVIDRQTLHIEDLAAELDEFPDAETYVRRFSHRTILATPLLREGLAIGAIAIRRTEVRPFLDNQVDLLKTFADQAVIAIENVRLFTELQSRTAQLTRSVEQLTALGDVGRALSSTLDLDTVLQTIVTRASQLAGTDACSVFEYDEATEAFHLRATHNLAEEVVALARRTPTRKGEGVQGRMAVTRQPVQIPDIAEEDAYRGPLRDILLRTGTRAVLAIPMLLEDQLIGGLTVNKKTPGEFSPEVVELLTTFATQSALAIQNARLFREIEDKSRQLEVASQHKSEFLANMSHELRTPLNAIIGFSEVLSERMFGDLNEKQEEYLRDIYASGQHLLSLINDILDLSKIEAGRMELELTDFDLPQAIDNALILVRERAGRRGIALEHSVAERLGEIRGDERKVKQILLNLLSNALKFTPEGGRVEVIGRVVDGMAEISVTDTGVGIAPEDQEAVFEEFRQVGTSAAKQEGTGLGLALCRKFVELHGGKIGVTSQVGVGSTFTFTLPLRR